MRHIQGMDNAPPHLDVLMLNIPKQDYGRHQTIQSLIARLVSEFDIQ